MVERAWALVLRQEPQAFLGLLGAPPSCGRHSCLLVLLLPTVGPSKLRGWAGMAWMPSALALALAASSLTVRQGGRQRVVSGLPMPTRGQTIPPTSVGSQPSVDLDQQKGINPGEISPFPSSSSLPGTTLRPYPYRFFGETPHAKQTHLLITCCVIAACGEAMPPPPPTPSEASLRIPLPLFWPLFPLFLPLTAVCTRLCAKYLM